ncbi:hypothetical protein Terro_3027 [Terriglobus roseus DSM 18391]|uniref:Adenylate cyclase n=1 Tax=Terriglobus roseus (strain DSM 18391 / NRRL B-41598 / KBS 63) TaxID=926566 RepID=I3ZJ41_TERRK|nr:hypothetical protein [Terriglobus roseus]AFL89259.1 hypothetical protein Terro_3027 [Terriglobus roseus DSM 18391]
MSETSETEKTPFTLTERARIESEVAQILSHASFRNSARCSKLLRFLVDGAVRDEPSSLKERLIGHQLFGRATDYDTGSDPVVRNTASEVRKRLAQYYQAANESSGVRIGLNPGSYVPEINLDTPEATAEAAPQTDVARSLPISLGVWAKSPRPLHRLRWQQLLVEVAFAGALIALVLTGWRSFRARNAVRAFWGPVFQSNQDTVICIGYMRRRLETPSSATDMPTVAVPDAASYAAISALLDTHGMHSRLIAANLATYPDLMGRNAVLLGAFNNPWTLRLSSALRYKVGRSDEGSNHRGAWIEDSVSKDHKRWTIPWVAEYKDWTVDYAIAGRVHNPATGELTYFAAGAGKYATEAAGTFLTQERYLRMLPLAVNDPKINVEVVLKVDVVNATAGPPQLMAVSTW